MATDLPLLDYLVDVAFFDQLQEVPHVGLLLLSCCIVLGRWMRGLALWIPGRSHWGWQRCLSEGLSLDRRDPTVERGGSADHSLVRLLRYVRSEGRNQWLNRPDLLSIVLCSHWLMLYRNLFWACWSWQRILRDRHLRLRVMRGL